MFSSVLTFHEYSSRSLKHPGHCGRQLKSVPCTLLRKTPYLTLHLVTQPQHVQGPKGSSICTRHRFSLSGHAISYVVVLVMVDNQCPGGHPDRGGNDTNGAGSPYWILQYINRNLFATAKKGEWLFLRPRTCSRGTTYDRDKHAYWYLSFEIPHKRAPNF